MSGKAVEVVRRLRAAGFLAFFVGGCVRDMLQGATPEDYDVATDATIEQIALLFGRQAGLLKPAVVLGRQDMRVVLLPGSPRVHVSPFRLSAPACALRAGKCDAQAEMTGSIAGLSAQDALRKDAALRDFTINGMFFDPIGQQYVDEVGGRADLEAKMIRAVGNPFHCFGADPLRMLRAARFSANLGFTIDPATYRAILASAEAIDRVSPERISQELFTMLHGPRPAAGFALLRSSGLLQRILPELEAAVGALACVQRTGGSDGLWARTLRRLDLLTASERRRTMTRDSPFPLAVVLVDVGADVASRVCLRLRLSTKHREFIVALIRNHQTCATAPRMSLSALKRFLRNESIHDLLELHRIQRLSNDDDLSGWTFCRAQLSQMTPECLFPPRLMTGHDLLRLGFDPGPNLGKILRMVEDAQLDGRVHSYDEALEFIHTHGICH